jgi:hypothetical protein
MCRNINRVHLHKLLDGYIIHILCLVPILLQCSGVASMQKFAGSNLVCTIFEP